MIALGRGLYRRRRAAWAWALVLLTALTANNLLRGTTPETAILSGLPIIDLLVYRKLIKVRAEARLEYGEIVASKPDELFGRYDESIWVPWYY